MKYRLIRDDGVELDVPGALWEATLEIAFRNGWKPAGTEEPRDGGWRRRGGPDGATPRDMREWPRGDYFSRQSQYVRPGDARQLSAAILRAQSGAEPAIERPDRRVRGATLGVAEFARSGGFLIGTAGSPLQ